MQLRRGTLRLLFCPRQRSEGALSPAGPRPVARLSRTTQGQALLQRAKSLASRMNERTRQLLRVLPRVDEWHTAIREVRSIARSDRRNGMGTADGLDLQISKIN
jgi:hypothetical protein